MRVLLLNWKCPDHPAAGGAEVYTHQVLRRWASAGHQVTWFSAAVDGQPSHEVRDGITIVRAGSKIGVYRAARRFTTARQDAFDVVIDEVNTRPFLTPRFVTRTPVVALVHQVAREIWYHELPRPLAALGCHVLEPRWLRVYRDTPVLTVSDSSAASLRQLGLNDITVVPEGIDPSRRATQVRKAAAPALCFVGRLAASKRPHDVLDAFALVRERLPTATLDLIGDGPLRDELIARAVPGVRVHGFVDDATKAALVGRAHALLLASVREGWGLVVDEAALLGTHAIAYDRPGLRDSVPAAGGVLAEPTPTALADAILTHVPGWRADPPTAGWSGGATDWDTVAAVVLDHVEALARGAMRRAPAASSAPA